jgi:hypothetical protein
MHGVIDAFRRARIASGVAGGRVGWLSAFWGIGAAQIPARNPLRYPHSRRTNGTPLLVLLTACGSRPLEDFMHYMAAYRFIFSNPKWLPIIPTGR